MKSPFPINSMKNSNPLASSCSNMHFPELNHLPSTSQGNHFSRNQSFPVLTKPLDMQQRSMSVPAELLLIPPLYRWTFEENTPRSDFNKNGCKERISGMRRYYDWRRYVTLNNTHPLIALKVMGVKNSDYKLTSQKERFKIYSLRLNHADRVVFTIDEIKKTVDIMKIGGHD